MISALTTWLIAHIPHIGVGGLFSTAIWIGWKLVPGIKERNAMGLKAMAQIDSLSTNHFPHIQESLQQINEKTAEANKILADISTGIAVLVDRKDR